MMDNSIPRGRMGKREEIGKDGALVRRVVMTSYALPSGLPIRFKHEEGCLNGGKNEEIMKVVEMADPKVVSELEMVLKGVMITIGCGNSCGIDKEQSAGILFEHSQDSEYVRSSVPDSEHYVSIESPAASAVSSWGNSTILDRLPSSEKMMYKNYKDDRTSDEDFEPRKVGKSIANDTAMGLENGKTTEGNGIGDSKHAEVEVECSGKDAPQPKKRSMRFKNQKSSVEEVEKTPVDETPIPLPSTMPYGSSNTNEMLEALGEMECGQCVPGVVEMDMSEEEVEMEVQSTLSDHDKINRLERLRVEEREMFDQLRDKFEDFMAEVKEGKYGCENCKDRKGKGKEVPYIPKQILKRKVETGESSKVMENKVKNADVPAYRNTVGSFANERCDTNKKSWSAVAKAGDKDGFTKVVGKAERKTVAKKMNIIKHDVPILRERHLKIRFLGKKGVGHTLPEGVSPENVRVKLNQTLKGFNVDGYFSIVGRNRWGDIELTLARTRAIDLVGAGEVMKQALEEMGLENFEFARDTKKVKIYVAMVPLMKGGYGREWKIEDWQAVNSFDQMIADIEESNPGIHIEARPSWVGKLGIMKERKQTTAGLTILCEENSYVKEILMKDEPKMLIAGKKRFCRVWREKTGTSLCDKCCTVGHTLPECKGKPVCRWCRKEHLSTEHKCPIVDCPAPKGVACMHCRRMCNLCESDAHYTGFRECTVLRNRSTPPIYGKATPMESDNTSANGVNDRSRNRFQITNPATRKTPVDEQLRNNLEKGNRTAIPKKERSSSVLSRTRNVGGVESDVTSLIR